MEEQEKLILLSPLRTLNASLTSLLDTALVFLARLPWRLCLYYPVLHSLAPTWSKKPEGIPRNHSKVPVCKDASYNRLFKDIQLTFMEH